MKIFFDTEFTGLHKNTTLLSIGLIDENGRTFYGEFTDYDRSQINDWIEQNVLYNMFTHGMYHEDWTNHKIDEVRCNGSKWFVKQQLEKWFANGNYKSIELVSDVCHYDMVLFIDLWGDAFSIPNNINPACHDINQDIAKHFNISEAAAFDLSREEIVETYNKKLETYWPNEMIKIDGEKHNSLYDAKVIKAIYKIINI